MGVQVVQPSAVMLREHGMDSRIPMGHPGGWVYCRYPMVLWLTMRRAGHTLSIECDPRRIDRNRWRRSG